MSHQSKTKSPQAGVYSTGICIENRASIKQESKAHITKHFEYYEEVVLKYIQILESGNASCTQPRSVAFYHCSSTCLCITLTTKKIWGEKKEKQRGKRKGEREIGRRQIKNRTHNIFETTSSICAEGCLPGMFHHWNSEHTLMSLFLQTTLLPPKNLIMVSLLTVFLEVSVCASLELVLGSHTLHSTPVSAACDHLLVQLAPVSFLFI